MGLTRRATINVANHNTLAGRGAADSHPQSAITGLATKLSSLDSVDEALEGRIDSITTDLTTVQGDITGLTTDLAMAQGDITGLTTDLATAQGDITGLTTDLDTAQGNITVLTTDLATAEINIIDNKNDITELDYNVYQLYLQMYYDGKFPLKKGLFFDGFADAAVIDSGNSDVLLDTANKKITFSGTSSAYISQTADNGGLKSFGRSTTANKFEGQTFTVSGNITITEIKTKLYKYASPSDNVVCKLYNVSGGLPTTVIATSSNSIAGSSLSTSTTGTIQSFTFNQALTAGTYAFSLERTGSLNDTNYYGTKNNTTSVYVGGNNVECGAVSGTWTADSTTDLYFEVYTASGGIIANYQTLEQLFEQNMENVVLYIKSKVVASCSVVPTITVYTGAAGSFENMTAGAVRDLGGGYQEQKFTYTAGTPGNKIKLKLSLNRPDTLTSYEVNSYGCLLGVS